MERKRIEEYRASQKKGLQDNSDAESRQSKNQVIKNNLVFYYI